MYFIVIKAILFYKIVNYINNNDIKFGPYMHSVPLIDEYSNLSKEFL